MGTLISSLVGGHEFCRVDSLMVYGCHHWNSKNAMRIVVNINIVNQRIVGEISPIFGPALSCLSALPDPRRF